MFPILFSIGQFQLHTAAIFNVIAFFLSGFMLWQKGREEHYSEAQMFDGFLLATIAGFAIGRVGHVLVNWSLFGLDWWKWFDFVTLPGVQPLFAFLGALWYFYRFAQNKKWDAFEALDYYSIAAMFGMFWRSLGAFFDGSQYGLPTSMPWGIVFPGVQEKVHPIQLYLAVFSLLWFFYLLKVEYRYRLFEWYRSGKKTAETGFLLAATLISYALVSLALTWMKLPEFVMYGIMLDRWIYLAIALFGAVLLWNRSGRSLFSGSKTA